MNIYFFLTLIAIGYSQNQCVYQATVPNSEEPYTFNLTSISRRILEIEEPDHFYYYTPCRNGLTCQQGNVQFATNAAQFKQGANQCTHYLSVDHHEQAQFSFRGASWRFEYSDGQLCDITQQPRKNTVFFHCNDVNNNNPAIIESAQETSTCNYVYTIKSTLACVPANEFNSNCQWKAYDNADGNYRELDLSELKGKVIHATLNNGYEYYYSVCANGLHCYQQHEGQVMAELYNRATGTCEHNLGVWENGNVQPAIVHNSNPPHWSFHFWNGDRCSDGRQGEFRVRWFCDATVDEYKVIDEGVQGDCDFFLNVSTKHACFDAEPKWVDAKELFSKGSSSSE